jgi:DUF4097 and DUF4098 domain-containing protein YvlB
MESINREDLHDENEEDFKEENKMVNIINAFQTYFKRLFKREDNENMFSDMNTNDPLSTNRSMEFLYDHVFKYQEIIKKKNTLLYEENDKFDLDTYPEFYALLINNEIIKLSESVYALIEFMVLQKENWFELKWEIMNLKNN